MIEDERILIDYEGWLSLIADDEGVMMDMVKLDGPIVGITTIMPSPIASL